MSRYRFRFSFLGVFSGLLLGVGLMILAQQYAIAYPTRELAITAVAGGALLGLVLPNLAAMAGAGRKPATAWAPTHVVPPPGLPAYATPGGTEAPAAQLDPGLEVQLLERRGALAHVRCSNGWECWIDATGLVQARR